MSCGNEFHRSSSELTVSIVVNEVKTVLVVQGSEVSLSNSKANGTGDTLTERAGCELDT